MRNAQCIVVTSAMMLAALFAAGEGAACAQSSKPNVILLMAEDMGLDLECYGARGVKTPNLNRLAAEGARFTRAYCAAPICSPNRSAMMVGVHQTLINAQHHRSNRDTPLPAPFQPITRLLRDAGYTCILGSTIVRPGSDKIDCNFKHQGVGPYDGVGAFGLFDRIGDFSAGDQPFFNQITLMVTHRGDWWNDVRAQSAHPVSPDQVELPPYFADTPEIRRDWATYLDQVEAMDKEVGLIMQALKAQALEQNTIVIFIADNGRCNLRGKGYLYEPGIHIPMIVWAPGYVAAGTVVDELVSVVDISATILKLAGATLPDYLTPGPFLGIDQPEYRSYVRSARDIWDEINECSRSITTKHFKYIRNYLPEVPWATDQAYLELNRPALHVMRRMKEEGILSDVEMTFFRESKPVVELYDLVRDPHELNSVATNAAYTRVREELEALEAEWRSEHHDDGLADLADRHPETGLGAVKARAGVKASQPELWQRLEAGELMKTHAWIQKYGNAGQ